MKKLFRNSLIAFVVAVAGATGFANQAHAQSVDVDFSGNVGNTCEISKNSDGSLAVLNDNDGLAANSSMAEVIVNCAASGLVTVGVPNPTTPDATAYVNFVGNNGNAELWDAASGGNFLAASAGDRQTYTAVSNGSDIPIYVSMFIRKTGEPIPAGNYGFRTTLTVTPQ